MLQNIEAQSAAFRSIIANMNKTYEGVDPFFKQIEHLNTQLTYIIVGQLAKHLSYNNQPINKVNALAAACKLLEVANYPTLLLAEIYLVPCLQNAVEYVVAKPDFKYFTAFFQEEGYNPSIPHLQNLSYNFLTLTCQFIQLASTIKPLRIYEGKEYSEASLFKRQQERLNKSGYQVEPMSSNMKIKEGNHLRQKYINSLSRWDQIQEEMLVFYIKMLDFYLSEGAEPKGYYLNFIDTLKYGETSITSQIIARLIDVIAHGQNFKIRSRALRLFDNFILWGDVEALLVANYAEHIQLIIQSIWKVKGNHSLQAGRNIYVDIPGQEEQKQQFYIHFLRCLQTWSECYPTKQFFCDSIRQANEHSTLYQLYRLLKDKKRFIFPQNLGISKYQRQSHRNIREKLIRNQMILNDISAKTEISNLQKISKKTLKDVEQYYQIHKEYLLQILHKGQDYLYENMKKLLQFKENFENSVESIDTDYENDEAIDSLIQNGLELIDLISAINIPYIEFLKQDCTYPQFKETITSICYEYFNPKKNQNKLRQILSEKLKVKKEQLKSMMKYQKSIPLWNELQAIFSNINLKQLRSKYQQKKNKSQNSKNSQSQSSISLEIYTKTKFTKESRQQRLKAKHDCRQSIDASLQQKKNHSLLVKNKSTDQLSKLSKQEQQTKDEKNLTGNLNSKKGRQNKKKIIVCSIPKMKSPLKSNNDQKEQPSKNEKTGNITSRLKQSNTLSNSRPESTSSAQDNQTKQANPPSEHRSSDQSQYYPIPFEENRQYFTHLDDQRYKFSYVYAHIVIFKSSYLTIERVVTQIPSGNKIKVKVQIILMPYQPLYRFQYAFENQECIELEDHSARLPEMMTPNGRYSLKIIGTMKKIPLKLPTIAMSINSYPIFEYILPFTINFFLPSWFSQLQSLQSYSELLKKPHVCYSSARFNFSSTLFSSRDTSSLMVYFPNSIRVEGYREKYLWQVKDKASVFFVLFQFTVAKEELIVKIFSPISQDNSYHLLFRFILNCLAHILARGQAK